MILEIVYIDTVGKNTNTDQSST